MKENWFIVHGQTVLWRLSCFGFALATVLSPGANINQWPREQIITTTLLACFAIPALAPVRLCPAGLWDIAIRAGAVATLIAAIIATISADAVRQLSEMTELLPWAGIALLGFSLGPLLSLDSSKTRSQSSTTRLLRALSNALCAAIAVFALLYAPQPSATAMKIHAAAMVALIAAAALAANLPRLSCALVLEETERGIRIFFARRLVGRLLGLIILLPAMVAAFNSLHISFLPVGMLLLIAFWIAAMYLGDIASGPRPTMNLSISAVAVIYGSVVYGSLAGMPAAFSLAPSICLVAALMSLGIEAESAHIAAVDQGIPAGGRPAMLVSLPGEEYAVPVVDALPRLFPTLIQTSRRQPTRAAPPSCPRPRFFWYLCAPALTWLSLKDWVFSDVTRYPYWESQLATLTVLAAAAICLMALRLSRPDAFQAQRLRSVCAVWRAVIAAAGAVLCLLFLLHVFDVTKVTYTTVQMNRSAALASKIRKPRSAWFDAHMDPEIKRKLAEEQAQELLQPATRRVRIVARQPRYPLLNASIPIIAILSIAFALPLPATGFMRRIRRIPERDLRGRLRKMLAAIPGAASFAAAAVALVALGSVQPPGGGALLPMDGWLAYLALVVAAALARLCIYGVVAPAKLQTTRGAAMPSTPYGILTACITVIVVAASFGGLALWLLPNTFSAIGQQAVRDAFKRMPLSREMLGNGLQASLSGSFPGADISLVPWFREQGLVSLSAGAILVVASLWAAVAALYRYGLVCRYAVKQAGIAPARMAQDDPWSQIWRLSTPAIGVLAGGLTTAACLPYAASKIAGDGAGNTFLLFWALTVSTVSLILGSCTLAAQAPSIADRQQRDASPARPIPSLDQLKLVVIGYLGCGRQSAPRFLPRASAAIVAAVVIGCAFRALTALATNAITGIATKTGGRQISTALPATVRGALLDQIGLRTTWPQIHAAFRYACGARDILIGRTASDCIAARSLAARLHVPRSLEPLASSIAGYLVSRKLPAARIEALYVDQLDYGVAEEAGRRSALETAASYYFSAPISALTRDQARFLVSSTRCPGKAWQTFQPQSGPPEAPPVARQEFAYYLLPTPKGDIMHSGALSDNGEVAGRLVSGKALFLWKNGKMGAPPDDMSVDAINAGGDMLGDSTLRTCDGQYHPIDPAGAGAGVVSYGMNNKRQVVGYFSVAQSEDESTGNGLTAATRPFLWQNGQMELLDVPRGYKGGRAYSINAFGEAAGWLLTDDNQTRACVWENGTAHDLGTFPGGRVSLATCINDVGQIVGAAEHADGSVTAFLCQNGVMHDLGRLNKMHKSRAYWINNSGIVVGASFRGDINNFAESEAFMWDIHDGLRDLLPMVRLDSATRATLRGKTGAYAINNHGQILCVYNPKPRALFLLTPERSQRGVTGRALDDETGTGDR